MRTVAEIWNTRSAMIGPSDNALAAQGGAQTHDSTSYKFFKAVAIFKTF